MLLAPPSRVFAACDPNRPQTLGYNHVFVSNTMAGARAVFSSIKTYYPYVEASGFSYAWAMLAGPDNFEWAQIGPYRSAGSLVYHYQFNQPGGPEVRLDLPGGPAIGSVHTYSVGFDPATHLFHVYLDGVDKAWHTLSGTPSGAQIAAETWLLSSQMMGEASLHETFRNGQIMTPAGSWQAISGGLQSTDPTHFSFNGNAANFDSWDRCNR